MRLCDALWVCTPVGMVTRCARQAMRLSAEGVRKLFDNYDSSGDGLLYKADIKVH